MAGIGRIGGMGSMGGSAGIGKIKDNLNAEALNDINKKHKNGGSANASIETLINTLNDNQKVGGTQSGTTGETGTRINKYA